jgi:hypothetical protein
MDKSMARSLAKRNPRDFGRRFASVVQWLLIGLISACLLWAVAMVLLEALVQLSRR